MKKLLCKHLIYTLPFPITSGDNVYFYCCLKCDKFFTDTPLFRVEQWVN